MLDLSQDALTVAPQLLGAVLYHGGVGLRLTEVEAYLGADDPASHAFRGPTPRTQVMFGPSAHLYVYLSYGMHLAANIVCGVDGEASAVLLRAGEVVSGLELARERRGAVGRARPLPDTQLARGPGCVGQALGLVRADSGAAIAQAGDPARVGEGFLLLDSAPVMQGTPVVQGSPVVQGAAVVRCGPRVGVSQAADEPWRFWIDGDPTVSRYSRSPRAASAVLAGDPQPNEQRPSKNQASEPPGRDARP